MEAKGKQREMEEAVMVTPPFTQNKLKKCETGYVPFLTWLSTYWYFLPFHKFTDCLQ